VRLAEAIAIQLFPEGLRDLKRYGNRKYRPYHPAAPAAASLTDFSEITERKPERSLVRRQAPQARVATTAAVDHLPPPWRRPYVSTAWLTSAVTSTMWSPRVAAIHYDPHRNARLACSFYTDGEKALHSLRLLGLKLGQNGCRRRSGCRSKPAMP